MADIKKRQIISFQAQIWGLDNKPGGLLQKYVPVALVFLSKSKVAEFEWNSVLSQIIKLGLKLASNNNIGDYNRNDYQFRIEGKKVQLALLSTPACFFVLSLCANFQVNLTTTQNK
jgi:hypothetical protein